MTEDGFFRLATVTIMVAGFGISGGHRARAERVGGALPAAADGLPSMRLRAATGLLLWGAVLLPLLAPRWLRWSELPLPEPIRWLGLAIGLLVLPFIWWTLRSLGSNVSASTSTRVGATLVTAGPYRWIRHPIYTAGSVMFLSFALMLRSAIVAAAFAGLFFFLPGRVRQEEANLTASFGEGYREYARRTGRFIPRFGRG